MLSLSSKHIDPNVVSWTGRAPDSAETGLEEISGNLLEADFWAARSLF
jgi:hypothetical protein